MRMEGEGVPPSVESDECGIEADGLKVICVDSLYQNFHGQVVLAP